MGKLKGLLKGDIIRVFGSSTFILAVIATALIMLTGSIGVYEDNTKYNVFQYVIDNSASEMEQEPCIALDAIMNGSSSYIWMFAPVLAGMPLIPLLCAERKNKAMRYELVRVNKKKYAIGKMLAALISGGLVISLGYLIYMTVVLLLLPDKGNAKEQIDMMIEYEIVPKTLWQIIRIFGYFGIILVKTIAMFLFGACSSILAYILSSFITNKYIVLSIPFIVNYMISMLIIRVTSTPFFYEHSNIFTKTIGSFSPELSTNIFMLQLEDILIFITVWLILIVLSIVFYIIIEERRCDCGQ